MSLDANDPRLTDFVLGELSADDRAEIETALADSPELERTVEEIRATCEMLARSLQNRPALALTDAQRTEIEEQSTTSETATTAPARRFPSKLFLLATAASLLIAVSIGAMMKFGDGEVNLAFLESEDSIGDGDRRKRGGKTERKTSPFVSRNLRKGDIDESETGRFRFGAGIDSEAGLGDLDKNGTTTFSSERVSSRNSARPSRFGADIPAMGGFRWSDSDGDRADDRGTDSSQMTLARDPIFLEKQRQSGQSGRGGQIGGGNVLAEPTLVTRSGHSATFIPAGEFAVPTTRLQPPVGSLREDQQISSGKNERDIDENVTLEAIPDDDGPSVFSLFLGFDGGRTADMDIKVAEARLQELAGKWKEEIRSDLKGKIGGESAKEAQIREKYFELRDAIHKSQRLAEARKLPESSTGKKLAKLDKDIREADKLFAVKPARSWRRVKATPNATRMMIGNHEELPLQGMQANVQIDGFRARVLLDYYFYNDRDRQFTGTFKLRLPNEASLYFFAFGETAYTYRPPSAEDKEDPQMRKAFFNVKDVRGAGYRPDEILKLRADTWKAPKVARIVQREKAAFAFRETVRQQIDPALVEWSGAGVFSASVFPLMPKKLHRIVIGYDVDLTKLGDDLIYTLDLPEGVSETAVDVNLAAVAGESATIEPTVKPFTAGGRAYFNINRPGKQVSVRIKQPGNTLLVGKDEKAGDFFAASVKADLPDDQAAVNSPYGVFLLDTSLSSNPDKFNVYLKLLREILVGNRDTMRQFAVLTFNVEAHWWERKFVDNTPANVDRLMKYCHTLSLEGATDLAQAVRQAARPEWFAGGGRVKKWDVFLLSDGGLNWGERNLLTLSKTLNGKRSLAGSLFAYHTGMSGTASRVLTHLTRETGGAVFTAKGEDALADAAKAHRKRPWQLEGVELAGGSDLLLAGRPRTIYPGQDLLLVGRGTPAKDASVQLKVRRGEEVKTLSIKLTRRIESELAPRTYGHVATGQLESLGSLTEEMSVAYARHFRITGQTCSLLMLETDADYKRFNIKPEDDLVVVKSSPAGATLDKKISEAMTVLTNPKEGFTRWLARLEKMPGMEFRVSPALRVALDNLPPEAFEVPHARLRAKHRTWEGMSDELKEKLSLGKVDYDMLQKEAQRRMSKYGEADAMVALSSLIENSPGDLVLARDVAYSAIEWGLNDQAYHLLHRVAMARPYEPQMYLAMAQSLAQAGKNDLALLYYEVVSSGKWNNRFRDFSHIVAVDYLHFLRQIDRGERKLALKQYAKARLDRVKDTVKLEKADLLVTVMWNTDGTDVDLHVKEPTGEVCFYQNRRTRIGGQITQDCTQGFGPELYTLPNARHGKYEIQVKYFARDTNRASGRTRVLATIYEGWGTKQERVIRKAVTLTTGKQMHAIATVGIEK